jgi:hypothetical protein
MKTPIDCTVKSVDVNVGIAEAGGDLPAEQVLQGKALAIPVVPNSESRHYLVITGRKTVSESVGGATVEAFNTTEKS